MAEFVDLSNIPTRNPVIWVNQDLDNYQVQFKHPFAALPRLENMMHKTGCNSLTQLDTRGTPVYFNSTSIAATLNLICAARQVYAANTAQLSVTPRLFPDATAIKPYVIVNSPEAGVKRGWAKAQVGLIPNTKVNCIADLSSDDVDLYSPITFLASLMSQVSCMIGGNEIRRHPAYVSIPRSLWFVMIEQASQNGIITKIQNPR